MNYTFLSEEFYRDYPHEKYPQMEIKETRPYAHLNIELNSLIVAVPLRSNIDHPHAYFTNKKEKCGADYSKVVIIFNDNYIDNNKKVYIRDDEHKKLRNKEYKIKKQLENYIELYKQAKVDETVPHRDKILEYSTLQYFEEYIYSEEEKAKEQVATTSENSI